jgi:hypothetical protein
MRVMVLVKSTPESEASGALPSSEELAEMGAYNEELVKAGIMLAGEGLRESSKGVRVVFDGKKRTFVDGPFTETKELLAGFWIWQVKSMDEAVEWIKRSPFREGTVELRQVSEPEDFAPSDPTGELREAEAKLAEQIKHQNAKR